jgi:diadenosine tetraphosphate (Ap4A) HIT family hydrolase
MLRKIYVIRLAERVIWQKIAVIYSRFTKVPKCEWCPFCKVSLPTVANYTYRQMIQNIYPHLSESHLLLIPNRCVSKYSELTDEETWEKNKLLWDYLSLWYMSLGRQYPMAESSVPHLHIHLIKNHV